MRRFFPFICASILLTGCSSGTVVTNPPPPASSSSASATTRLTEEGNPGAACTANDQCQTPMRYLLRSNCPFGSLCIDHRCAVVCAQPNKLVEGRVQPQSCAADADCDCGAYAANDRKNCRCVYGACVAVVE